jgi:hypothetical protein
MKNTKYFITVKRHKKPIKNNIIINVGTILIKSDFLMDYMFWDEKLSSWHLIELRKKYFIIKDLAL